ncbi:MAG: Holliday junction branch migration protein RuvA [Coriobacteriia bacterium]|nr:Holliday junction branch migration protein RuvA [Coriobacteriia bacterium]
MIAHVTGVVSSKSSASCVVEVGGIGLRLFMSTASLSQLPAEGDEVTVYTYLHVREDELSLFGFESPGERELFEKLITVSGIGPKVALSALSALSPEDLAGAIAREDDTLIATVPGIGKKTAQRLIIELKDKIGAGEAGSRSVSGASVSAEAAEALTSMGFSSAEVAAAFKGYEGEDDAQVLLRHALKRLGGGS